MVMISPAAFRASVEQRLREEATRSARPINRVRTLLIMERFIARLAAVGPDVLLLKGGFALELRLDRARTTRDIDLRAIGSPNDLASVLRRAAEVRLEPDDLIEFSVAPNAEHPEIDAAGYHYDGFRFIVRSTLAGKPFGDPFGLDVAYADPIHGTPHVVEGSAFFERYGIPRLRVPVYPLASHVAEKLHAYTVPRPRPNSRVKDLVDLAMIAQLDDLDPAELRRAIELTFAFRRTHEIPVEVPDPPEGWSSRYLRMREEDQLPWTSIDDVLDVARAFLDPVLAR